MSKKPGLGFLENRGRFTENHPKSLVRLLKNVGRVKDPPQTITNTHATEALVDDPLGNARQSGQSQH